MSQPLHPNLARLAAAYDEIVERHRSGRISARQARGEVAALMGRDDTGLVWTINPHNGRWCYRNLRGDLVEADPPRFGVPSPTPAQLGAGEQGDLDRRVSFFEVDNDPFTLSPIPQPVGGGRVSRFGLSLRMFIEKLLPRRTE
jgi:hypothetical protein